MILKKYISTQVIEATPMVLWQYYQYYKQEPPAGIDLNTNGAMLIYPGYEKFPTWVTEDYFNKHFREVDV